MGISKSLQGKQATELSIFLIGQEGHTLPAADSDSGPEVEQHFFRETFSRFERDLNAFFKSPKFR